MPARSRFCFATSFGTRIRTGSRCTILVKLPVALSGGSKREHRARRGRNAVDDAGELAMAVGVDRDLHGLAGADALELGFLEVGVDEDVVERHHIGEPLAGLDEVAGI